MKIISNFKDYYDYLQGKYGQDPKAVYERICEGRDGKNGWVRRGLFKPEYAWNPLCNYSFYILAICGTIYCVYWYKDKIYHGPECAAIPKDKCPDRDKSIANNWGYGDGIIHLTKTTINESVGCPVMIIRKSEYHDERKYHLWTPVVKNPRLSDFNLASVLPATQIWVEMTNFLLSEPVVESKQTDLEKVVAHGFDKRTSFRKM